jgi:hypothetical protein
MKRVRKLSLTTETLKRLGLSDLKRVEGGGDDSFWNPRCNELSFMTYCPLCESELKTACGCATEQVGTDCIC